MLAHICNPSTCEAATTGSLQVQNHTEWIQGQPELHGVTLSLKDKKIKNNWIKYQSNYHTVIFELMFKHKFEDPENQAKWSVSK